MKIWLLNLFFYKCGDNDISVATFVATLIKTLDATVLEGAHFRNVKTITNKIKIAVDNVGHRLND
jgi:hypothetical protein